LPCLFSPVLLLSLAGISFQPLHTPGPGPITGIVEGDTIKVRILAKPEIKVRIAFIDAPEKGQGFDQRAKAAMSELVLGKDVVLQPHTIDRSGRLVARMFVDNRDACQGLTGSMSMMMPSSNLVHRSKRPSSPSS